MSLFSTLNTGVSGMSANQLMLSTASHNISNVNNEHYTRQRVSSSARYSVEGHPINTGLGVQVDNIVRIHDEFVFSRLKSSSGNLEYSSFSKDTLEEIGQYFPDLQKVGLKQDIENYFNAWNAFASSPSEGSQKINLVTTAQTLTDHLQDTRVKIRKVQDSLNNQLKLNVDEINRLGKKIAQINKEIAIIEAVPPIIANDLRDERDRLELTMSKLVNISVFKGDILSDNTVDRHYTDRGEDYNINLAGVTLVDGVSFRPLTVDNSENPASYYSIYIEREDEHITDLTTLLSGGKVGAILDLRGRDISIDEKGGYPYDGILQGYIDDLDTLSKSLIVQTNNIYAMSASSSMDSYRMSSLKDNTYLMSYDKSFQRGDFDVIVYDRNGEELVRKTIYLNETTSMSDDRFGKSIITQLNSNTDDNMDNDITNDFDDYFNASYKYKGTNGDDYGVLEINSLKGEYEGFTIAFEDHGTNFAGTMGMKRFFSGNSAKNIEVDRELTNKPDTLTGSASPASGDNKIANQMVQLQYEEISFYNFDGTITTNTIEGQYRSLTTNIASDAEQMRVRHDTNEALYNTVHEQFQSISGVSLDEELASLIKFQTAYSSNAKVLTTIDKMLDALIAIR